jgi:hypothetical protein
MSCRNEREANALLDQQAGDDFPEPWMEPSRREPADFSGLRLVFVGLVLFWLGVAAAITRSGT